MMKIVIASVLFAIVSVSCSRSGTSNTQVETKVSEARNGQEDGLSQLAKHCNSGKVKGIDLSHFSGDIDWERLLQEQQPKFVFLKTSEGIDLPDTRFHQNFKAAKKYDVVIGGYHFFVTADSAEDQFALVQAQTKSLSFDLPFVVDIEHIGHGTPKNFKKEFVKFLNLLENHFERPPIIYTSPKFWAHHVDLNIHRYPLWIAQYEVEKPDLPSSKHHWLFWQFKGEVRLPSVEKDVDLSYFNCDWKESSTKH